MILNILFLILAAVLGLFGTILQALNFSMPQGITDAIIFFVNIIRQISDVWPLPDTILMLLFILAVWQRMLIIKIILWAWSLLPWIGRNTNLPSMNVTDLSHREVNAHTVDLSKGRVKTKFRSMADIRRNH